MIPQANPLAEVDELRKEIDNAIDHVLNGGRYINGPEVKAFEEEFSQYIGVKYACGVASGTDAIRLGLMVLGVGPGDEVITVSHTAVATVAAIEQCGAKPVMVDVDPDSYTINPECLEQAITSATKAVIPVHLYGHPADLTQILKIAKNYNLYVLEDCAQAHGAVYKGIKVGGWGDIAAFSFYPTKNLGAIGDGGMIVTQTKEYADRARLIREYGWRNRYISEVSGCNSRLDELQAAILRVKLKYLDKHNLRRHSIADSYTRALKNLVKTPIEKPGCYHVYHLYVVRTSQRVGLKDYLADREIGTGIHYPVPIHMQPAYQRFTNPARLLKTTEEIADQILSLPLYPQMSDEQVLQVINTFQDYFNEYSTR